jgi:hypothetical protein
LQDAVAKDVIDQKIDPTTCYIDRACAGVTAATDDILRADLLARLDGDTVKRQLCEFSLLANRVSVPEAIHDCLGSIAAMPGDYFDKIGKFVGVAASIPGARDRMMTCGGKTYSVFALWTPKDAPSEEIEQVRAACEAKFGAHPLPVPEIDPNCFRGRIGAGVGRLRTARQEVNVALAQLQTVETQLVGKWDICGRLMQNDDERRAAQASLDAYRGVWAEAKGIARRNELVSDTAGAFFSGFLTGAVLSGGNPVAALFVGFSNAIYGGSASKARQNQKKLDDTLRLAETKYQQLLENQSKNIELVACFNEAESLKSAAAGQVAVIRAQALAVETALIEVNDLMRAVRQSQVEGAAVLAVERARKAGGFSHHFWFDEKVARFHLDFPWAKRLTYLAVRALEYETQATLGALRNQVIAAFNPTQLDQAVKALKMEQATRQINGRRPEEKSLVLSLRDEVWKVADRTKAATGERAEDSVQRFKGRLAEAASAIRDRQGRWLGQGIRFSLDAVTRSANRSSLPSRCAERLWRVVATVQGDGLATGAVSTGAELQLLQMNTFASQSCDRMIDPTALLTATIQPSKNLFRPGSTSAVTDEARTYGVASLTARFNKTLTEFASSTYTDGKSDELAGRGLFGDYILLFPQALIDAGFPIDKVEDVILRLDHLSVDDTPIL